MLVDAANKKVREQLDPQIIRILKQNQQLPSILVLNRVSVCVCACMCVCVYYIFISKCLKEAMEVFQEYHDVNIFFIIVYVLTGA